MTPRFVFCLAALLTARPSPTEGSTCLSGTPPTASSLSAETFYVPNAPVRNRLAAEHILADPQNVLVVEGRVYGNDCTLVSNAVIEVWYAGPEDAKGYFYSPADSDLDYRGTLIADECGRFNIVQTYPTLYLGPPHVHFRVSLPGDEHNPLLFTEMYFEESLVPSFRPDDSQLVSVVNMDDGSRWAEFNIHLDTVGSGRPAACGVSIVDPGATTTDSSPTDGPPVAGGPIHSTPVTGNGNCIDAYGPLRVMAAGSASQNTLALTTRGITVGGEEAPADLDTCIGVGGATSPTAWFSVRGTGGLMTASTCWPGTNFDTRVTVFEEAIGNGPNCTSLFCIAANDDASTNRMPCPFNALASRATWASVENVEYTIMVHGFDSRVGEFELSIEAQNDSCEYAALLTVGDRVVGDTTHAVVPWLGSGISQCPNNGGVIGANRGLWWAVLGTGNRLEISTCNDVATTVMTRLHVMEASCDDASTCIGGVYETEGCATFQWDSKNFVQYFVLVSSVVAEGSFGLTLREVEVFP